MIGSPRGNDGPRPRRAAEFRQRLGSAPLVGDGAMATMLQSRGASLARCCDELNLSSPDLVRQVHGDYAAAGADILQSNTFGGNRARLSAAGLANRLVPINEAGVRLAREAASSGQFVAGTIGPLGVAADLLRSTFLDEARGMFREQAEALLAAGADLLVLETFADLDELREAVLGAREAAGLTPVIVAQVTVDRGGQLLRGVTVEAFTRQLESWPADVIGVNCSVGPESTLEVIERMARLTAKPLSAVPSAGLPMRVEGRISYPCSPEQMAAYARRLLATGAKLIGGCCGTTPEHIRLVATEVRGRPRAAEA